MEQLGCADETSLLQFPQVGEGMGAAANGDTVYLPSGDHYDRPVVGPQSQCHALYRYFVISTDLVTLVGLTARSERTTVHRRHGAAEEEEPRNSMKFAMGAQTLSTLTKQTSSSSSDLGALVRQLAASAEPLQGKFNGAGRAAFDAFHSHTDEIATELNQALASVLRGISGMDHSFQTGDSEMAESTRSLTSSSNFDAARFSGRG
ncbi:WXG100 family type VII secretion target [Sinomonas albida]|uniref:WXG100 family type VII secretion target n=1 Tax=Sinomonas albida TaxID=369942 RepID=UPI002E1261A0